MESPDLNRTEQAIESLKRELKELTPEVCEKSVHHHLARVLGEAAYNNIATYEELEKRHEIVKLTLEGELILLEEGIAKHNPPEPGAA